jgi:hypothetical protein
MAQQRPYLITLDERRLATQRGRFSVPPGRAAMGMGRRCCRLGRATVVGSVRSRGEAPVSVAAVAAWWVDHLQLLEIEFGNRLQLLGQP